MHQSLIMGHLTAMRLLKLLRFAKELATPADVQCRIAWPQLLLPQPGHPHLSASLPCRGEWSAL